MAAAVPGPPMLAFEAIKIERIGIFASFPSSKIVERCTDTRTVIKMISGQPPAMACFTPVEAPTTAKKSSIRDCPIFCAPANRRMFPPREAPQRFPARALKIDATAAIRANPEPSKVDGRNPARASPAVQAAAATARETAMDSTVGPAGPSFGKPELPSMPFLTLVSATESSGIDIMTPKYKAMHKLSAAIPAASMLPEVSPRICAVAA
ncbi:hypothetical protein Mapa_005128 [Marchantia paleacea]|nr:hypothetical protein Mapa_005128 [Marchantia paleacea]